MSQVKQNAFLRVDEQSTEAAAATGGEVREDDFVEYGFFRADDPFLFLIRHKRPGSILFRGRVVDPSQ